MEENLLLGDLKTSFGSVMSAGPIGLQMRQSPSGLSCLLRTSGLWSSAEYSWDYTAHTLFSLIMLMILLAVFSITLSITHGTNVIIYENSSFSRISLPKILWKLMLLMFFHCECQFSLQISGAVLTQCWQDWRQITPISVNMLPTRLFLKMCAYLVLWKQMYLAWYLTKLAR